MRIRELLAIACTAGIFVACVAIRVTGSKPIDVPRGEWDPWQPARISLAGLDLEVQIQNMKQVVFFTNPLPITAPLIRLAPLRVWLSITPLSGSVGFDPGRVALSIDGTEGMKPVGYWGPGVGQPGASGFAAHMRCGRLKAKGRGYEECFNCVWSSTPINKPEGAVPLAKASCFVLVFETRPSPKHRFELSLEGLERNGSRVTVPQMKFEKGGFFEVGGPGN